MKVSIKILIIFFYILFNLIILNYFIFAQNNQSGNENEEKESIYAYLTAEEAFFLISYSNLEELKKIADSLGIKYSENVSIDELKKLLYEYYNFREVKKEKSEDVLYIKSTDFMNISENNKIIDLIGNNIIIYKGYLFKADRIIFYIDEETFYGFGNVSFKTNELEAKAESFQYSITLKKGTLYNATIYLDKYIISTSKANISNNSIISTEKATVTQCKLDTPHYYIRVNKVLYSESIIYFYELEFVIGGEDILYFPIYISYEKGYDYPLLFGMDYGYREGFMFFNTLIRKDYQLYLDFYERLGIYIGFKTSLRWNKDNLNLISGFAVSPDLFYNSADQSWTIVPFDAPFSLYNLNLRAAFYGDIKVNSIKDTSLTFRFAYYSDPYFSYDYFQRERFLRFDITQFTSLDWQDDYNLFPSSNLSFVEELISTFKIDKFSFNLSSALNFTATPNTSFLNINLTYYLYSPKYYKYYLSSIKWYNLSLGGNIISYSDKLVSFNISNSNYSNYFTYFNLKNEQLQAQKNTFSASTSLNPSFNFKLNFFNYSFSMNNNLAYSETILLVPTESIIESLIFYSTISNSFNFQFPIFQFSLNIGQSYRNSLLEPIDFGWISNRATASIIFRPFTFISFSANINYNFLNSTTNELWVFSPNRFETANFSSQFKEKYFTLSWNARYSIENQLFLSHQINLLLSIPKTKIWFFWLTFSDSMSLKIDETNIFSSYFENNFSMIFSIENQIQISFRVSSYNPFLYRYNTIDEVFIDLLNSFNFFDYNARLSSFFDLRSLSLSITRYLHDMTVQFQISGSFVLSSDSTKYNFVLSYSIYIVSSFLSGYEFSDKWESIF